MLVEETSSRYICNCDRCGKEFFRYKGDYKNSIPKYCSSKCYHDSTKSVPIIKRCEFCGKEMILTSKNKNKRFCNNKCSSNFKSSISKRKIWIGKNGYKAFWDKDKGIVKEHVYIMEQFIGRKLNKNEVVHHKDFNKLNNDISNLQLLTRGEHSRLHRLHERNISGNTQNLKYAIRKGQKPYNARKVVRIEDGKIYDSTGDCAKDIGGSSKCVWSACSGKLKTYKGFHFSYIEETT